MRLPSAHHHADAPARTAAIDTAAIDTAAIDTAAIDTAIDTAQHVGAVAAPERTASRRVSPATGSGRSWWPGAMEGRVSSRSRMRRVDAMARW